MKKSLRTILLMLAFTSAQSVLADAIDSLENRLSNNPLVQEKIYIHTDNNSYFTGDTIWYKAYLLRADDLRPAAFSRIMYVELLSPDGYLVERQRIVVEHNTQSYGQFALPDTIYSGYYELRAYTRWQLNFNVSEREHSKFDDQWFYNKALANDYFRDYEGLYSRVFPIYEKPEQAGDYSDKRIISRPKRRAAKLSDALTVSFFPEGGNLVAGVKNRVAFEVLDADGKPQRTTGTLADGTKLQTNADGRGTFTIQPDGTQALKASFLHEGKTRTFELPAVLPQGAVISYDAIGQKAEIMANGVAVGAVAVTCRGRLVAFQRGAQSIDAKGLPTGVNEITVYDGAGVPLAVRQIFVNRNDIGHKIELQWNDSLAVKPFERLDLRPNIGPLKTVSIAVCDQRGDEASYDDGNILTDLLLAGELRGFVAHPAQYFEADDDAHRTELDLLMMIQGWRRYVPLAVEDVRYAPEQTFAVEGNVYKLRREDGQDFDLLDYLGDALNANPVFTISNQGRISTLTDELGLPEAQGLEPDLDDGAAEEAALAEEDASTDDREDLQREYYSSKKRRFKEPVTVEAELNRGTDVAGVAVLADSTGRFAFTMPPFYDNAILFMTGYATKDSAKMCMTSTSDKTKMDPFVMPDYYVQRELFYPKFSKPYSWFQTNSAEKSEDELEEDALADSLGLQHTLGNVTVKQRRRRPLRAFDKSKPAFVYDFNTLLNDAADRGLHYGCFNSISFWMETARELFGNMNNAHEGINIKATVEGHTFLKTFNETAPGAAGTPMTPATLKKKLDPRHILQVRVFTDYDMRNGVGKEENRGVPDVWFEVVPIPHDNKRAMRRDRRLIIDGFAYPEQFYNRSYADSALPDSADYRRTLYWNANAHPDAEGNLNVEFYNGSRPARLKISICGVSNDGQIFYY